MNFGSDVDVDGGGDDSCSFTKLKLTSTSRDYNWDKLESREGRIEEGWRGKERP